jgi:redox-sensitive bicupin YhaK (pirin superfamily)
VVEHLFRGGRGGYIYLIDGKADVNGDTLSRGDAAKILGAGALRMAATATSELIIVDTPL